MINHYNKFPGLVLGFPKLGIFYECLLKTSALVSIELTSWMLKASSEFFGLYTQGFGYELIGVFLILKCTIIQLI